jgi:hypothetical protein
MIVCAAKGDDGRDRQARQPEREADRELIKADADTQRERPHPARFDELVDVLCCLSQLACRRLRPDRLPQQRLPTSGAAGRAARQRGQLRGGHGSAPSASSTPARSRSAQRSSGEECK